MIIVQDSNDAQVNYMPLQALETANPDHVLTAGGIGKLLNQQRAD
jgi:hypothetical protein